MGCDAEKKGGYRFAGFELASDTLKLRSGERIIALPPLSRRFLLALLEAAPGILSYENITSQVWGKRYVSLETITQRVKLLREALGDNGTQPQFIELVRGEGYRLIPTVRKSDEQKVHKALQEVNSTPIFTNCGSKRLWLAAACVLIAVTLFLIVGGTFLRKTPQAIPQTAQELFNHGQIFLHRRAPGDLERAEQYFLNSIRAAPDFPESWVALAGVYGIRHGNSNTHGVSTFAQVQRNLLLHALTLAPDSAAVHARLGLYYECVEKKREKVQEHLHKAYQLAPDNESVLNIYGHHLIKTGNVEKGIKLIEKAISIRPDSRYLRNNLAIFYMWLGQFARAEEQLDIITELIGAEEREFANDYARLWLLQKRPAEAIMYIPVIENLEDRLAVSAIAYGQQGMMEAANRQIDKLSELHSLYAKVRYAETVAYFERYAEVESVLNALRIKAFSENSVTENQIYMIVSELSYSPFLNRPDKSWEDEMALIVSS